MWASTIENRMDELGVNMAERISLGHLLAVVV
jgi:hypothetical protein